MTFVQKFSNNGCQMSFPPQSRPTPKLTSVWALSQTPWKSLQRFPYLLTGFKGAASWKERTEEEGREGLGGGVRGEWKGGIGKMMGEERDGKWKWTETGEYGLAC